VKYSLPGFIGRFRYNSFISCASEPDHTRSRDDCPITFTYFQGRNIRSWKYRSISWWKVIPKSGFYLFHKFSPLTVVSFSSWQKTSLRFYISPSSPWLDCPQPPYLAHANENASAKHAGVGDWVCERKRARTNRDPYPPLSQVFLLRWRPVLSRSYPRVQRSKKKIRENRGLWTVYSSSVSEHWNTYIKRLGREAILS